MKKRGRFVRLWGYVEMRYWEDDFPRWFWRYLLICLDRVNGYSFSRQDYDG